MNLAGWLERGTVRVEYYSNYQNDSKHRESLLILGTSEFPYTLDF